MVKPFDVGGWFPIHTALFDVIMPRLSPDAWKALCVALRQTWGPTEAHSDVEEGQARGRISHAQFQEWMGGNLAAVNRALQECLQAGYLVRHEISKDQGEPIYAYALDRDFMLQVADDSEPDGAETELGRQGQEEIMGAPGDQFIEATWRLATGNKISGDGVDALWGLLGRDLPWGALANIILELGGRVEEVTVELVEAVVTGKMSIPSLQDLEESAPPPEPPHGPVMAATSTTETDPLLAQVTRMYESEIGLVTAGTAQHLLTLTAEHRDVQKWREAFDAVVRSNIRRLDYLIKCLENVGKPKPKPARRGRRQRQESAIREKPAAVDVDAETRARQKAALAELKRRQREREQE